MALRKVNKALIEQIKLDKQNAPSTAVSISHVMSKEDYLSIYEFLFTYNSVQVSYNKEISNEEEQVVVTIGI